MNIKEASAEFIAMHKPSRIDVNAIKKEFGSLVGYMEHRSQPLGDPGEVYIEIPGCDSITGLPIIVMWDED